MQDLEKTGCRIRLMTLETIHSIGNGHVGGSLSIVDVLTCLYFGGLMNVDPTNSKMEGRDRLIVSKGHAGPAVYATLAEKGFFPKEQLQTLNHIGTMLPSHCDMNKTTGIDMTTGSLGQGFSCAVGAALGSRVKGDGATIYTIVGDGESQEGQIWEAAMFAAQQKLSNLIAFTDYNKAQLDGYVSDICGLGNLKAKWESFGWQTYEIDGHDYDLILRTVQEAKTADGPVMILLDTVKGKGFSMAEALGYENHGMTIGDKELEQARKELAE